MITKFPPEITVRKFSEQPILKEEAERREGCLYKKANEIHNSMNSNTCPPKLQKCYFHFNILLSDQSAPLVTIM